MDGTGEWWTTQNMGSCATEEQLAYLRQQVEAAEADLVDREAELVDLRTKVFTFWLQYDARVGRKVAELEELEAQIERCRERISQYRKWGPAGPPHMRPGAAYVPVEEQYRRAWQQPEKPPFPPSRRRIDADQKQSAAAGTRDIRELYRQLCRRFHPDLTQDEAERAWRTEMMTAINAAYVDRSLVELQALAAKPDRSPIVEAGTDEQRLASLHTKLEQIRRRLQEVEREIRELTNSQTLQTSLSVKLARLQGRDLLAEMAADVEKDLARKRVEQSFMVAQLKQLGMVCE